MKLIASCMWRIALAGAGVAFALPCGAQTGGAPRFPTMEEIDRAAQQELRKGGAPAPAGASRLAPPAIVQDQASRSAGSELPPPVLPQAIQAPPPDEASRRLMELLTQQGLASHVPPTLLRGSLYVAISFSMPPNVIRSLAYQATAAGASLLIRGFDVSPGQTRDRLLRVVGDTKQAPEGAPPGTTLQVLPKGLENLNLRVSPKLFERFEIREVPAFVVVSPAGSHDDCTSASCAAFRDFVSVQGDVSIGHAMEAVSRARPAFRPVADFYGRRAAQKLVPVKDR